ncbi:hypothetical protein STRTUCAR8_08982 [Streptomyces turgidiscabies Car8]|uniref:Uncharacterized protein n=1 Tax=Streptomyces turgidiscabies (strain Car8) TaxID=698760 RepID=L7FKE6_STRT8|nr:hypothetical protein STRTUCAR8_08982 [Streptomyces turgidiscabies Car8]
MAADAVGAGTDARAGLPDADDVHIHITIHSHIRRCHAQRPAPLAA